jgi:hypothetical protein
VAALVLVLGCSAAPLLAASAASAVPRQSQEPVKVNDPASTRKVYLVIAGLAAISVGIAVFTIRYWRSTRPEPDALGRLEAMSMKRWERADYTDRRSQLDDARTFTGGDGPMIWDAPDEPETWAVPAKVAAPADPEVSTEAVEPATAIASLSLAELSRNAPPAPTPPAPIGDLEVLRALGLDDESLGLATTSVPVVADDSAPIRLFAPEPPVSALRRWWSRRRAARPSPAVVDEPAVGEPDGDDDRDEQAAPGMAALFDDPGLANVPVWHPEDELSDEEVHEREATGEFVRLVGEHHDEPEPEQQRFVLPGEPLL